MDLKNKDKSYQCLVGVILDLIDFFLIQSHQLLVFCMDDREYKVSLDYVLFIFLCNIVKINRIHILQR